MVFGITTGRPGGTRGISSSKTLMAVQLRDTPPGLFFGAHEVTRYERQCSMLMTKKSWSVLQEPAQLAVPGIYRIRTTTTTAQWPAKTMVF